MKRKIAQKMLLIGLMLGVATVTRPAQAPLGYQLPLENSTRNKIVHQFTQINDFIQIKRSDFENWSIDLQNQIINQLLKINRNNVNLTFLLAAQNNLLWAIQPLLDRSADIRFVNENHYTALMLAVEHGHTAIVELLIAAGTPIDTFNKNNISAFMLAAQNGHTAIVELLIAAGTPIDTFNKNNISAFMLAAEHGHTAIVELLMAAGAPIDTINKNGTSALILAAKNGHTAIVALLMATGRHTYTYTHGKTALLLAAEHGHTATVELLIDAGIPINYNPTNDYSPLELAAEQGHTATNHYSALELAAEHGHTATVEALMAHGAQINSIDYTNHYSATMLAARNGHTQTVITLIAHGARVNAINRNRQTALMLAAQNGHIATVQALIACGARVEFAKKGNDTALTLAAQGGHTEIVDILMAHKADINRVRANDRHTALTVAAQGCHTATVDALIQHGIQVDFPTALQTAISLGKPKVVKILVNAHFSQLKKILNDKYTAIRYIEPKKPTGPIELILPFEIVAREIAGRLQGRDIAHLRETNTHCHMYAHHEFNRHRNESIIELKQKRIEFIKSAIDLVNTNIKKHGLNNETIAMMQFLENELKEAENLDIFSLLPTAIANPQQPICALDAGQSDENDEDLDADIAGPAAPGCAVVQARNAAAQARQNAVMSGCAAVQARNAVAQARQDAVMSGCAAVQARNAAAQARQDAVMPGCAVAVARHTKKRSRTATQLEDAALQDACALNLTCASEPARKKPHAMTIARCAVIAEQQQTDDITENQACASVAAFTLQQAAHVAVQPMETTVALQQPALAVNQKNGLSSQAQSATDEMVAAAPAEAPTLPSPLDPVDRPRPIQGYDEPTRQERRSLSFAATLKRYQNQKKKQ